MEKKYSKGVNMLKIKQVYDFLSAMKTGIFLLMIIGLISAIGTVINPNHFFHTTYFKALLLLLFINLGFCTINQVSKFIKVVSKGKSKKAYLSRQISLLMLHLGIVLILVGGIVNAYNGQSLNIKIVQGDSINTADIINTKNPFSLTVNKFIIAFYDDGSPSQYISEVSIKEKDKLSHYSISVNHPLKYQDIKAYQHSYGYMVEVFSNDLLDSEKSLVAEGQTLAFNNTSRTINLYRYIPNYDMRYGMNSKTARPDNPKIIYSLNEGEEMLGIGLADFDEEIVVDDNTSLAFTSVTPYTVLTIKSDPGLWLATVGSILFMLGICWFWLFVSQRNRKSKNTTQGGINNGHN